MTFQVFHDLYEPCWQLELNFISIMKFLISVTFNSQSYLLETSFLQHFFCYISVFKVLEEPIQRCGINNYNKENKIHYALTYYRAHFILRDNSCIHPYFSMTSAIFSQKFTQMDDMAPQRATESLNGQHSCTQNYQNY